MKSFFSFFFLFVFYFNLIFSQNISQDSSANKTPTTKSQALKIKHSPRKAALYSVMLPGLGQAYNKRYWKIPIVIIGFGTLGYFIHFNHQKFVTYRDEYIYRNENGGLSQSDEFIYYTNEDLLVFKNWYRRNMEYSIVFTGLLYVLNIVDAYVDAQMLTFDISDDLSMKIEPAILYSFNNQKNIGINLSLKF